MPVLKLKRSLATAGVIAIAVSATSTLADPEDENSLSTDFGQAVSSEAISAPLGIMSPTTPTIESVDGTGLRAISAPTIESVDGTGLQRMSSDGIDSVDGTGGPRGASAVDMAASGQPLITVDAMSESNSNCAGLEGVASADASNCDAVEEDSE